MKISGQMPITGWEIGCRSKPVGSNLVGDKRAALDECSFI